MHTSAPWTSTENQTLTEGLARGLKVTDLVNLLPGRSWYAVDHKIRRLRIKLKDTTVQPRRPWTQDDIQQLLGLYWKGLKYAEIASALDRSLGGVQYQLWKHGRKHAEEVTT